MMAVDSGKTVVLAALGRPFSLGMLYDCRNDSLIPEANKESKSIRFLATAITDDEMKGATFLLYKDGSLVTDNFEPPSKPEMFCVHGDDVWRQPTERQAGEVTVSGFKIEYRFRCRATCAVGLSPACEALIKTLPSSKVLSSTVLSSERLAEAVKKNEGVKIKGPSGNLDVMDAGKSTLVNRVVNYILGVTWDDTFRFKLVDEGTAKSQAHSQTSEVTVYKLNHREGFQIDHSLTIVDTAFDVPKALMKAFGTWKTNSMKRFFSSLNVIETKSLTLTKEVLRKRGELENCLENFVTTVKLSLTKLEEIE
ncbi:unnamed protein product [Boreogadus saida]